VNITLGPGAKFLVDDRDLTRFARGFSLGTPITASYRPDGSLKTVQVDYAAMTPQEREDIAAWITAHHVDPGLVPIEAEIGFDPSTDEWRFPVYVRGAQGGIRLDTARREPLKRIIRRRRQPSTLPMRRAGVEK
jgi:hypothetical protein